MTVLSLVSLGKVVRITAFTKMLKSWSLKYMDAYLLLRAQMTLQMLEDDSGLSRVFRITVKAAELVLELERLGDAAGFEDRGGDSELGGEGSF